MRPYISCESCTQCLECIDACPYDVFGVSEGQVIVSDPGDCIECASCVEACPHSAIRMDD